MDFEVLKKELAEHKVYTAWQFIENTNANIRVAWYCLNTIAAVSDKMTEISFEGISDEERLAFETTLKKVLYNFEKAEQEFNKK